MPWFCSVLCYQHLLVNKDLYIHFQNFLEVTTQTLAVGSDPFLYPPKHGHVRVCGAGFPHRKLCFPYDAPADVTYYTDFITLRKRRQDLTSDCICKTLYCLNLIFQPISAARHSFASPPVSMSAVIIIVNADEVRP